MGIKFLLIWSYFLPYFEFIQFNSYCPLISNRLRIKPRFNLYGAPRITRWFLYVFLEIILSCLTKHYVVSKIQNMNRDLLVDFVFSIKKPVTIKLQTDYWRHLLSINDVSAGIAFRQDLTKYIFSTSLTVEIPRKPGGNRYEI